MRRQEATAKLLTTIQMNDKLPPCSDINSHPSVRLLSKHPVFLNKPAPDTTAASEWIDAWFNTTAVNQSAVTDPTICPLGLNMSASVVHTEQISNCSGSKCRQSCSVASGPSWLYVETHDSLRQSL